VFEKYWPLLDKIRKVALETSDIKYGMLFDKIQRMARETAGWVGVDVARRPGEVDKVIEYWTRETDSELIDMLGREMPGWELSDGVWSFAVQPNSKKNSKLKRMLKKTSGHGKKSFHKKPHWKSDDDDDDY